LEKSLQARFLIPMAISLGFGVLFATAIILLIVPSLYMIVEDFLGLVGQTDNNSEVDVDSIPENVSHLGEIPATK